MAAVLDAFASKLLDAMVGMAKEEVEMLLGVPGEITKLETTLGDLSSILADAERRRICDYAAERWVRELKDVMYDADDILDLCQIMEGGEDPSLPKPVDPKNASGCWNLPMMSCFRNPVVVHEIGKKIQALNQRLEDIAKRSSRFGFITQVINSSDYSTNKAASSLVNNNNRKTGSAIIQSEVVGEKIVEDTRKLVQLLVNKVDTHANVVVSAITGVGGIGKATLARMVFNNNMIEENFDKKIWLSVNQEVNDTAILQTVIAALGGNHHGCGGDKALLENALKHAVAQKKFFLVMDDVWSNKVWNDLLRVPLNDGASGSKVLMTTRNSRVARGMRAHHLHAVDKLDQDAAWSLLKNQVILNESDESEIDIFEDIGKKIVEKCDGLPLTIKVVGGLLLNKGRTRDTWLDVSNRLAWTMIGTNYEINQAVLLSYEELPSHLKQCFLLCSLIPKGKSIIAAVIVRMWIAEGYICNTISSKLEDLGIEYYNELVSRNLLDPEEEFYAQSGCTMHDVVHSFAQYIMKEEGLLVSDGQHVHNTDGSLKLRHISISDKASCEWDSLRNQVSLRTLMSYGGSMGELHDLLSNLSSLRILKLNGDNLDELPDSICHLKHLRYLGITNANISAIPDSIGDLKFLQFIDLSSCLKITEIPKSILKLCSLRFFSFQGTSITSVPRGFEKLKKLVVLLGFPAHSDDLRGRQEHCTASVY